MKTLTLQFLAKKETPGAVQYKEVDAQGNMVEQANAVIGTLYVRKTALDGQVPQSASLVLSI